MIKSILQRVSAVRRFSEQQRFSFAPRTAAPAAQQHSMAGDVQDDSDLDFGRRRTSLPPVSMGQPQGPHQPPSAAVFPEELGQVYSVDDFPGLGGEPFADEIVAVLHAPVATDEVEIKPDGAIYLPEVKYRKILNQAFGAGGWALIPRGPHSLNGTTLSREYALFCRSRFMSQARGSSLVQGQASAAASTEAVRSNALMRCCKDLGVASELWDRNYVVQWKDRFAAKRSINDKFGNPKVVWVKSSGGN